MQQKQWLTYTGKFLAVGILSISSLWVLKPEVAIAWDENCNVYGCSESPGVECNTFGCPKPGAGACTPLGCPDPPVDDGSNRPDDRGRRKREETQERQEQQNRNSGNCNAFGCSQSPGVKCTVFGCPKPGGGECTVFGCPNPGAGECTAFGCPESSAPSPDNPRNRTGDSGSSGKSGNLASSAFKVNGETCPLVPPLSPIGFIKKELSIDVQTVS
ncbi:hypothetical protein K9N68_21820 [Kovacikia minuta CCNUW1]|uniref:hypothetical protein n=1 Tax=Kovacikia minuta TaxID=2931930 RepID=UPI001CCCFD17|nr:hypothetical protein [Kovacikia minuta]UBF24329.1 hypothetical protein K9N68_21820 [Kovacikia minuta CCNUW1]